jgi:hypothetical protein
MRGGCRRLAAPNGRAGRARTRLRPWRPGAPPGADSAAGDMGPSASPSPKGSWCPPWARRPFAAAVPSLRSPWRGGGRLFRPAAPQRTPRMPPATAHGAAPLATRGPRCSRRVLPGVPSPHLSHTVAASAGRKGGAPIASPGCSSPLSHTGGTGGRTQRRPCAGTCCAVGPPHSGTTGPTVHPGALLSRPPWAGGRGARHARSRHANRAALDHGRGRHGPQCPARPRPRQAAARARGRARAVGSGQCPARPTSSRLPRVSDPARRRPRLCGPPLGRRRGATGTGSGRRGPATLCQHRARDGTPRQARRGALASPVSHVPATSGRGVGRRLDPAGLRGPGRFPAATRAGERASGCRAGARRSMAPPPVAVVARAPPSEASLALQARPRRGASRRHQRAQAASQSSTPRDSPPQGMCSVQG